MRGSHGTCRSIASSIQLDGFKPGSKGQLGKGAYFWIFADKPQGERLGRELAIVWHRFAFGRQRYSNYSDKSCTALFVKLTVEEDSMLDFDDDEVGADFAEFFEHAKGRYAQLGRSEVSSIRDEFIAVMEQVRENKYDAILGMVDVPHDGLPSDHFIKVMRRGRCASVQNLEAVRIYKIEDIQEG